MEPSENKIYIANASQGSEDISPNVNDTGML